ncbi:MAG: histidine phosphatase family protein [Rubrivivax sp.]
MADVSPVPARPTVWAWRHPRAEGAAGRCIGRTDLAVDARRAKGLARRIQATARRHGLPHEVHTSPLRRCADVGRWLRRWGWRHFVDTELLELDFGRWEGRLWDEIERAEVDDWCVAFTSTPPGGGETLDALLARAARWRNPQAPKASVLMVAHAGWMLARRWQCHHGNTPPSADAWPLPPRHEALWLLPGIQSAPAEVNFGSSDRSTSCITGR